MSRAGSFLTCGRYNLLILIINLNLIPAHSAHTPPIIDKTPPHYPPPNNPP